MEELQKISVRKAMAACLIYSSVSLDSCSKANASADIIEEEKTTLPDLFASLSMTMSSK